MPSWLDNYSDEERLALARERTHKLVGHISTLFVHHEANKIATYSPKLSSQIPRSYAGHAFSQFQHSMHLFEVARLCALWDKPSRDRESLPTIIKLISKPTIIEGLAEEVRYYHANLAEPRRLTPIADEVEAEILSRHWKEYCAGRSNEEEALVRRRLQRATWATNRVMECRVLRSVVDFRNDYIAHNLNRPEPDVASISDVPRPMQYGDERRLLGITVRIADYLHLGLNGTGFDWDVSREIARRAARELWENCSFEIPPR